MRRSAIVLALALWLAAGGAARGQTLPRIDVPPAGKLYHGVYPGGITGEEDDLSSADVDAYEAEAGQPTAWVYFSDNWYRDRLFPAATAGWIRARNAVPYIRLMIRSEAFGERNKRPFRGKDILAGALDADLRQWFRDARDFGTALLVEYGTECNGEWFPWNARWNGGKKTKSYGDPVLSDGSERFVAVYRRIVTIAREEGATNVVFVFHVNWSDDPEEPWNQLEAYYPGDDVVDWVAISAYGLQTPLEDVVDLFRDAIDASYARLQQIAASKPVIVAEFGATAGNPRMAPEDWASPALADLLALRWPHLIGFSWWNERWENDNRPEHDTTMRLQDVPELADAFATELEAGEDVLQTTPVILPGS